jgi:predicted permease
MFCLNATGPIFLMMVFGLSLRKVGILDEDFANRMNKFVFKIPLPFLLFSDLASVDFSRVWNIKFIVFCFVVDKHYNINTCFLSVEG